MADTAHSRSEGMELFNALAELERTKAQAERMRAALLTFMAAHANCPIADPASGRIFPPPDTRGGALTEHDAREVLLLEGFLLGCGALGFKPGKRGGDSNAER